MDRLPISVTDVLGEVLLSEQKSPGVFYFSVYGTADKLGGEYYLVRKDAKEISQIAKTYGKTFPGHSDYLLYAQTDEMSGWKIIEYEICKYQLKNGFTLQENESLHEIAIYNAETHPEYFGEYPVPYITPRGYTLRHKILANGIVLIETSCCERMLAVCYPIWRTELSETAVELGEQMSHDVRLGIDSTLGYLFFSEATCCIPLWELWRLHKELEESGMVDKATMMNAIMTSYPKYAMATNIREGMGLNSGCQIIAPGSEPGKVPAYIVWSAEKGTEFLDF